MLNNSVSIPLTHIDYIVLVLNHTICRIFHESSVGLSSTTNPSLGVAIPVPAQTHLYTHAKGRATYNYQVKFKKYWIKDMNSHMTVCTRPHAYKCTAKSKLPGNSLSVM